MTSEADFEHRLYSDLRDILEEKKHLIEGLKLTLHSQYQVDRKRADLVILADEPILVIETKRKSGQRPSTSEKTFPYAYAVIGQALCYAYLLALEFEMPSTPSFATANPDHIVVFKPIELSNISSFIDTEQCKNSTNYEKMIRWGAIVTLQKEYILKSYDNIDKSVLYELLEDVVKVAKGEKIEEQRSMFINLLKPLKIFVDLMDKRFVRDALKSALINDKGFRDKLDELAKENGYEKGLASLVGEKFENVERLSKMMVYVLLNKIIFYKILSKYYEGLRPLSEIYQPGQIKNIDDYLERLNKYFEEAISTTKNFEAIFITDLYDNIKISDEEEAMETIDDIIRIIREFDPMDFADIIGQIYDELIDPKERHALGQFYTPPAIARLISNWVIRSPNDKVLDPGCGSGTFISKAYSRLAELKTGKKQRYTSPDVHAKILDQIYGIDINAFAVQLASMHLAIKNPYSPSTNINIVNRDFFEITPEELVPSSYKVITPKGEKRREMAFRDFDVVIGNPPYTRWTEMSVKTRNAIKAMIGNLLERYNLMPNVGAGKEPQIYVYWIMHSTKFLKEGGRLGMIISNAWLSTDYGIRFGNFLLDRYRITALIDLPMRLFDALISTVILLAEKESDKTERENNVVTLIRIPPEIQDVEGVLNCIEGSFNPDGSLDKNKLDKCRKEYKIYYKIIKQSEIPRDRKWIELFSDVSDIINKLTTNRNVVKLKEYFIPTYGNSIWLIWATQGGGVRNLGAKDFFYFNESKAKWWFSGNMDCLIPAITSSSKINTFKFTNKDWEELKKKDKDVYIFICHHKRANLPNYVKEYINWGESGECMTKIRETRGGGKKCNEADASKAREKISGLFYGWYDLGGYVPTPIMTIYQPRYHPQFFLCEMPLVTYHAIITLIPKMPVKTSFMVYDPVKDFLEKMPEKERKAFDIKMNLSLDEKEIKALLAYMNSTFVWLWLELRSRHIPDGPLGLESSVLEEMPLLDVKRIDRKQVDELAQLFDKLEERARQLQKVKKESMFIELRPIFREIDLKINEILNLGEDVDRLWDLAVEMKERRIKGAEEGLGKKKEKPKRKKGGSDSISLDKFM